MNRYKFIPTRYTKRPEHTGALFLDPHPPLGTHHKYSALQEYLGEG